jgi:Methyltransferase domain
LRSPAEFATERRYPLDLYVCRRCALPQLADVVDPEVPFRHYLHVSGTSDTIAAHHAADADTIRGLQALGPGDLVVEVASNDGSLLRRFSGNGVRTLGIEPAENLAAAARASAIATLTQSFDAAAARAVRAEHGAAKAVVANNVLAHVDEPVDFLASCRDLVDGSGLIAIEVPYVRDLLDRLEYDTIYHEHLCYFSMTALVRGCDAIGLSVVSVIAWRCTAARSVCTCGTEPAATPAKRGIWRRRNGRQVSRRWIPGRPLPTASAPIEARSSTSRLLESAAGARLESSFRVRGRSRRNDRMVPSEAQPPRSDGVKPSSGRTNRTALVSD